MYLSAAAPQTLNVFYENNIKEQSDYDHFPFPSGGCQLSDYPEKGVRVTQEDGRLVIELHIAVSYGLNISTAARSISHRVKDEVEQATGLKVARVVVSVDDVIA